MSNLNLVRQRGVAQEFRSVGRRRYLNENFNSRPSFSAAIGYGNPTGSTGDTNIMRTEKATFEYHIKGTQTILAPVFTASGLNIAMDQTANDGVEITNGITAASDFAFTVGTDAFEFEVKLKPADVSGSDDLLVGFRKAEAYQAAVDDYDEMAALNIISGAISAETILNGATTTTTSTGETVADNTSVTLKIMVGTDRLVKFFVNGVRVLASSTFKFDNGEVVIPFLYFLQDADLMDTLYIEKWNPGLTA